MNSFPSTSITSSTSTAFSATLCTTKTAGTASCLSGILRRILCSRGLSFHPELSSDSFSSLRGKSKDVTANSPSLVARLMGLDLLPRTTIQTQTCETPIAMTSNSMSRSMLMDSVEFGVESKRNRKHRKVKSCSQSIVDMPAFFEVENDEFFVLSFGSESSKVKKDSNGEKGPNLINQKEVLDRVRLNNKKKKKKKMLKTTCSFGENFHEDDISSSEESSPVSVLDFGQSLLTDHGSPTSEEDRTSGEYNSKRRLSPELGCYNNYCKRNDINLMAGDMNSDRTEATCSKSRVKVCHKQGSSSMWSDICKLSERHVIESSWIMHRSKLRSEDVEQIGEELVLQILDQLLRDLVFQLV